MRGHKRQKGGARWEGGKGGRVMRWEGEKGGKVVRVARWEINKVGR